MSMIMADIPAGEWLSANQRLHWAQKARRTQSIRTRGFLAARQALPTIGARPGRTLVTAWIGYPTAAKADPHNAAPTVKALIDGCVDAGVFPDDDSEHVVLGFDRDVKAPRGVYRVRLELEALS